MSQKYPHSHQNILKTANQQALVDLFKIMTFYIACDVVEILSQQTDSHEMEISYDDFCQQIHARIDAIIQNGKKGNRQAAQHLKDALQQTKIEAERTLRAFHEICNTCIQEIVNDKKEAVKKYMLMHNRAHILH